MILRDERPAIKLKHKVRPRCLSFSVGCLTNASESTILICMKTTLNIDDKILAQAARLTGVEEKTSLVRMGLEALIARYSARRLAALGGSEPGAKRIPRRRTA